MNRIIGGKIFEELDGSTFFDGSFYYKVDKNTTLSLYIYSKSYSCAINFGEKTFRETEKECIEWLENELNKIYFKDKFNKTINE